MFPIFNRLEMPTVIMDHGSPSPCIKLFSLPESVSSDLFLHFIQIDILSEKHASFKIILKTTFSLALARWFNWLENYLDIPRMLVQSSVKAHTGSNQ